MKEKRKRREVKAVAREVKSGFYKVEDGKLKHLRPMCPRCGPGVFMAEHGNRWSCGRCGYTEFKKAKSSERRKP